MKNSITSIVSEILIDQNTEFTTLKVKLVGPKDIDSFFYTHKMQPKMI